MRKKMVMADHCDDTADERDLRALLVIGDLYEAEASPPGIEAALRELRLTIRRHSAGAEEAARPCR